MIVSKISRRDSMSEWKPFTTLRPQNGKLWSVVRRAQKQGEQIQLWPYNCRGKTFTVAIYAKSFLSPLKFEANGFLILDENGEPVKEEKICQCAIRDFHIWHRLYFYPLVKYIPLKKKFFSKLRQIIKIALEDCQRRYESNAYKDDDPAKKAYYQTLRELDLDVIKNHTLLIRNLETLEKIIDIEKSIWQRCSCEKIQEFHKVVVQYQSISMEMATYSAERGEIFCRYERAIKDAYKIDLQISGYSVLSKLALSFLLWLANTNLYVLAIPFLPEALKLFYQTFAGYKALTKKSRSYIEKSKVAASLLRLFNMKIDYSKIRNAKLM